MSAASLRALRHRLHLFIGRRTPPPPSASGRPPGFAADLAPAQLTCWHCTDGFFLFIPGGRYMAWHVHDFLAMEATAALTATPYLREAG